LEPKKNYPVLNKKEKAWVLQYRKVFDTVDGQIVLTDILNELGFFSGQLKDHDDMVLHNVATRILRKLGVWRPQNLWGITEDLMKRPFLDPGDGE
jgi:hypothetical protein